MQHMQTEVVRTSDIREAPPTRDRLPTIPEDLSEYAWIHTGPPSWSNGLAVAEPVEQGACDDAEAQPSCADPEKIDGPDRIGGRDRALRSPRPSGRAQCEVNSTDHGHSAELLVDLWHSDVPNVVAYVETVVDANEARILSLVDGHATIGTLLETSGLALPDVLGALGELCARGVITLDRSQRRAG